MLGRAAFDAGCAAAASGDRSGAVAWLDRACRLSPGDRTYALMLATHCLGADPARAAALFATVAEADDVREAWIGLTHACLRMGELARAAVAMRAALSRHVMLPGSEALAAEVATALAAAGWCGLGADGQLLATSGLRPEVAADGRAVRIRGAPGGHWMLPGSAMDAQSLAVWIDGREALGSPIALAAIRRLDGFVACLDDGLAGWAWHPGDPERQPSLRLTDRSGRWRAISVLPGEHDVPGLGALARPRRFVVPAAALAGLRGPFEVEGADGRALLGSPLHPRAPMRPVPAGRGGPSPPVGLVRRRRPVAVVIPVYAGLAETTACLDRVLREAGRGVRVVVVDDATPEPALAALLDRLATRRRIVLVRHAVNRGFPASVNAGLRACPGHDAVLLNSDVLVPEGWLHRLREAAYSAPDIGSVTPLTNDGSIVSYPGPPETNAVPNAAEAAWLDRLAARANGAATVDMPVGVGLCLYLRRDCLDATGSFREDVFAQGYGEEVDFCLRARHLGWRHVAATGLFVSHLGGRSFGAARRFLQARNQAVLNRLHPGFEALVSGWAAQGGLADARRRLDLARWRSARPRGVGRSVLLVTHDAGGGVEQHLADRCAALAEAGERPVVLRPARTDGGAPALQVGGGAYPNLIFALPSELRALVALLRAERPSRIELHHGLGHDPSVLDLPRLLDVPYHVYVHDYGWFCPRIALVGPRRRYCGEPEPPDCEACIAEAGRVDGLDIPVQALIDRSARLLADADRVVAPSQDTARRMRRHFPAIHPLTESHENGNALPPRAVPPKMSQSCRVVTVGAIGIEKGFDVLLDCARDAAARRLPMDFTVVGHTIDDARLIETGRIFITGEFVAAEAASLIRAQSAALGLLPSVWPETWCFALSDLWRAGLRVAAFDLGAQAERIRASGGRGLLLPLGLPAPAINDALLAAAGL